MRQIAASIREVKVLDGPMNVRWIFSEAVRAEDPPFLFYGGHGEPSMLIGEDIITGMVSVEDVTRAPWLVRGRIVVAIPCCYSAQKFGQACIKMGARAYLGATEPMYAAFDAEEHNYFEDWLDYMSAPYAALLSGKTVVQALGRYRERLEHYIQLYRDHLGTWPDADWHLEAATKNLRAVVLLGDPTATLTRP
ncbi:MAG: hypothetical protein QW687_01620 [Candidatus Hadarchaeales archaeon]